jgi:hypothetical protein
MSELARRSDKPAAGKPEGTEGISAGLGLIAGIGLGAGLMYVLDPDRGGRRRAVARDKVVHTVKKAGSTTRAALYHCRNHLRGFVAQADARLRHEPVADEVLVERVRAKLGRLVAHPRSIDVTAHQGHVILSGIVPADEKDRLVTGVSSVLGVTSVDDQLGISYVTEGAGALEGKEARQ